MDDVVVDKLMSADGLLYSWLVNELNIVMFNLRFVEVNRLKGYSLNSYLVPVIAGLKVIIIRLKSRLERADLHPDVMLIDLDNVSLVRLYELVDVVDSFIDKTFNKEVLL